MSGRVIFHRVTGKTSGPEKIMIGNKHKRKLLRQIYPHLSHSYTFIVKGGRAFRVNPGPEEEAF